ncbi:hypothetical protein TNIN_98881 [Trichonephila inaurata madagascariensis]|uniref:Uncharacterized protein n=1 Tax=Trichonephila inaurata madagascariensis TaxID=2747483 RepID=A0A8X7BRJ0_9ARAC|nr:hypothetical protein TNIN_98881 [Trichonephila inaurata madagascariensis]
MSTLIKKRYLSGAVKRRNQKEKSNKLAEQMNKTYKLFQLDFIRRTSKKNLLDTSPEDSKDSELVAKRVNDTRWCAGADVSMALSKGYSRFQKVLQVIAEDMTQSYR